MEGIQSEILRVGKGEAAVRQLQPNATLEAGCKKLGLLLNDEYLDAFIECTPWQRGGAETYIASGVICYHSNIADKHKRKKIIAKAYCGFGYDPERRVIQWQDRASSLAEAGASVCKIYSVHKGILYAEFIEWSLIDYLSSHTDLKTTEWAGNILSKLVIALDNVRVHAVSILPDLRTDGLKIYLTDFGEDIGDVPGASSNSYLCRSRLRKELLSCGFPKVANLLLRGEKD